MLALSLVLPFTALAQTSAAQSKPEVVSYHATIDNVKYVFGVAPPVARLKPGNILDANSLDCFGNALQKPGDSFSLVKGDNPLTGPFYIEGAEPGDTLVVHILDLQVDGKQGVGTFSPGFGAINATHYTPMLEKEPLPEKIWFYPIDHAEHTATFQALDSNYEVKIPLHPFLGCIGVAPAMIALVLYALLPVVRNTAVGLAGVDRAVIEAGRGMGLTSRQIFLQVELPLALPVLLAGLRIVTVQAIGLAVVAALIGAGGLGTFVFEGLGQYAVDLVLLGALPAIFLALAADFILQTLAARAESMRAEALAATKAKAGARSTTMVVPIALLGAGFLLLLIFPIVYRTFG